MNVLAGFVSGLGLLLGLIASWRILTGIFISDEEIVRLAQLPLMRSGTHLTEQGSQTPGPVAIVDVGALERYTADFIEARKLERARGRFGLRLLLSAFGLQLGAVVIATASA